MIEWREDVEKILHTIGIQDLAILIELREDVEKILHTIGIQDLAILPPNGSLLRYSRYTKD